jgi:AcrR family transcriptional regulator
VNIVQEKDERRSQSVDLKLVGHVGGHQACPSQVTSMSKTAERRQNLREALLRGGEATISRHGLAALKARSLAQEAGCAVGAIYNVFPDLDALIYEINARTLAMLAERVRALSDAESDAAQPDPAVARLVRLAEAYLDFAASHGPRWRALIEHRVGGLRKVPQWYIDAQVPLFMLVEEPLREIRPDLDASQRALLARNVFAAVHGVVAFGLDEKLAAMPAPVLRDQLRQIVTALGSGLRQKTGSAQKAKPRQRRRA